MIFKVKEKETGEIFDVYLIEDYNDSLYFLIYNSKKHMWHYINSDTVEPI